MNNRSRVTLPGTAPPADGEAIRVVVEGRPVAIFNRAGHLYAIGAECTHMKGPLDKGSVTGLTVRCPWHGSKFNLETGAVEQGPARTPVPAYRVRLVPEGLELEPV